MQIRAVAKIRSAGSAKNMCNVILGPLYIASFLYRIPIFHLSLVVLITFGISSSKYSKIIQS